MVTRRNDAELQTRDLKGVEILSPGRWNGRPYTDAELDAAVDAFRELGPEGTGQIRPPGKLGHDNDQALAQADGFPAIGWISNLYRSGKTLIADFTKIPGKVADLIAAGAYDSVSSECYMGLKLNQKVYPFVIGAVSFIGADLPAVKDIKSISDVASLFTDQAEAAERVVVTVRRLAEFSFEAVREELQEELKKRFPSGADYMHPWVIETYPSSFVFCDNVGRYWRGDYSMDPTSGEISLTEPFTEVNRVVSWAAVQESLTAQLAQISNRTGTKEKPDMELKKLAATLGLPETATEAEVEAKLTEIKAAAAVKPEQHNTDEVRQLREQVGALQQTMAMSGVKLLVDGALRSGKIVPAQREWAEAYALADSAGFTKYLEKAPKLNVLTGPIGADTMDDPDDTEDKGAPTSAELSIARMLGVQPAALTEAKQNRTPQELIEKAREKVTA